MAQREWTDCEIEQAQSQVVQDENGEADWEAAVDTQCELNAMRAELDEARELLRNSGLYAGDDLNWPQAVKWSHDRLAWLQRNAPEKAPAQGREG